MSSSARGSPKEVGNAAVEARRDVEDAAGGASTHESPVGSPVTTGVDGMPADAVTGPKVIIDPTKDLWQNISANVKDSNVEISEINLLVVGSSGSGKTTLLNRIYTSLSSAGGGAGGRRVKSTTALDYSFARRSERSVSQVAHFWELAQGTELAQLSEVVITPENIHVIVAAVVVDASEAGLQTAWETATYWLQRIDRRVSEIAQKMRAKGSNTPDKMLFRVKKAIGESHPDLKRMRLSGLPTVLVVNKLDKFAGDTQQMKVLARSMRFLAHLYGAHLIFTSEPESNKWRTLMSHILFQAPFDPKNIQFDHERGGVLLTCDKDTFADIGDPNVRNFSNAHGTTGDAELDRWKVPFDEAFIPRKLQDGGRTLNDPFIKKLYDTTDGYGEPSIDALRKQKDEELDQYRKNSKSRGRDK